MKPTIRRAEVGDVAFFATHLRMEDAREIQAAHPHLSVRDVLIDAVQQGEAYVLRFGCTRPCVLFGFVPVEVGIGAIWMVCTDGIKGHAISILREAGHWITYWKANHGLLVNYVELRNELHIRWLRLLSARFGEIVLRNEIEVVPFIL